MKNKVFNKKNFIKEVTENVERLYRKSLDEASQQEIYQAVSQAVKDVVMGNWLDTQKAIDEQEPKIVYYMSMEFLMGRALGNNLINLCAYKEVEEALEEIGLDLNVIEDQEPDPALGNGGLGRLAACFMESLTTLGYVAYGCGIRYRYGMFKQQIIDGFQIEVPDNWLKDGYPFELRRPEYCYEIKFGGNVEEYQDNDGKLKFRHVNYQSVMAMFSRSNSFASEYHEVVREVENIFRATGSNGTIPMPKTSDLVRSSLTPMSKQSGALDYLYELNHMADDLYNHSLRVAIMSGVIGKWLHMKTSEINDLVLAGFLHDIGKTQFPERLQSRKVETMKGDDFEAYMRHTVDGAALLEKAGMPERICLVAAEHHECNDGSGFPKNLKGDEISKFAKIVAIADLYDNVTTEREGYVRQTPFTAIAKITEQMYTKLDPEISVVILKRIKDVFLGSTVVLNNGLTGKIVNYPHDFAEHPLVEIDKDNVINLNDYKAIKIVEYNPK